ncbi:MAG: hemerythrin domain-containing protein [Xanthomonadales bacterium]|nr:hemerythrin domain-containing protein [Xanthomonadales bacterium]
MPSKSPNAIDLLKHDHREVEGMFREMEATDSDEKKLELGRKICIELLMHTQVEEEIFYPASKQVLDEDETDMVAESTVEHASVKKLIEDINGMKPDDELFDARFKVLKEQVQHHVEEEENELMPAVAETGVDLEELGREIEERKETLKEKMDKPPASKPRKISIPKPPATRKPSSSGASHRSAASKKRTSSASKKSASKKTASKKTASKKASSR